MAGWVPGSPRRVVAALVLALGSALCVAEGPAAAEPQSSRPIRLRFRSTVCPDPRVFWAALSRRTARVRPANPGEPADLVDLEVVRERRGIAARLQIIPTERSDSVGSGGRTVSGASCDEVIEAVTFMTALVFDPDAAAAEAADGAGVAAPHARRAAEPQDPGDVEPATAKGPFSPMRWTASAGAEAVVSFPSDVAWGGGAFVDFERASGARAAWAASLRLMGTIAWLGVSAGPVRARAMWRALEVDACPWRVHIDEHWSLRPCATMEGGVLAVAAEGVQNARSVVQPWVAPGVGGRVSYEAWGAWGVCRPCLLGLDLGLKVPLVRDEFKVNPSLHVFRAPPEVGVLGAFVAIRFL